MHSFAHRRATRSDLTDEQIEDLQRDGFTKGLAKALHTNIDVFPKRFWVVDNSESMATRDGHRLEVYNKKVLDRLCTRWDEIRGCVAYHSNMSEILGAPTEFRLLNKPATEQYPQNFSVCVEGESYDTSKIIDSLDEIQPSGLTPLTQHIINLQIEIKKISPKLEKNGQKAVIVLATDGLPVDETVNANTKQAMEDFVNAMRSLEGLPIWIVIRLCTDEEKVVSFYNDLDDNLELSLEVLDDYYGEAKEIHVHNKWLNYTLALHRMRELGFHDRVFDLIDERPLTNGELSHFFVILFGETEFESVVDPSIDWEEFVAMVGKMLQQEDLQWNPIKKALSPIIDIRQLKKIYGPETSCSCSIM